MSRILQIAKKCQLLTGSYDGNENSCPCEYPRRCALSISQRNELESHPEVRGRLRDNLEASRLGYVVNNPEAKGEK